MGIQIETVRALTDNYCYLVRGDQDAIAIDPSEAKPLREALKARGWKLAAIFNTHHHHDHVGGNRALVDDFGCPVYCAASDLERVPEATRGLKDGDKFEVAGLRWQAFSIPGHTSGQLAYYLDAGPDVFVGDTMFSMGCGRLFEGTPAQMLASLERLAKLPPLTRLHFGHEYTEKNASFAKSVEPTNAAIDARLLATRLALADRNIALAPTIESELEVNPFLREDSREIRETLKMPNAPRVDVFAELRARRDKF